jgi:ATP-dependent 26S proteasome regulatory subunit
LLSGPGAGALGQAAAIARSLQPSMVVLEDVDLVAMERMLPGMGTNPLLFQLLNEMDGLSDDADVVFVLTTNRVDLLEPALAARPGRIDQAVEIGLPDSDCRSRLLELYLLTPVSTATT